MGHRTIAGWVAALVLACSSTGDRPRKPRATISPEPVATPEPPEPVAAPRFRPPNRKSGEDVVMPVVFVDGSRAEVVADRSLRVHRMEVRVYTSGGLGGIDRTLGFTAGDGSGFMRSGTFEVYEGHAGARVELGRPAHDSAAAARTSSTGSPRGSATGYSLTWLTQELAKVTARDR